MNNKMLAIALATVAVGALVGVAAYGQTIRHGSIVADVKVPSRADNFRLVDQHSKAHELYYFKNAKAVVIITQVNGSQYVKSAAPAIKALKHKYAGQDVVFLMLNSSLTDSPKAVAAEMAKIGLDIPVMTDDAQLVGESLGVTREAQAFVIQPKTWNVVYSGPIDDRFAGSAAKPTSAVKNAFVADALDKLVAGKPLQLPQRSSIVLYSPSQSATSKLNSRRSLTPRRLRQF